MKLNRYGLRIRQIGPCYSDRNGSPVEVARLNPGRSYAGWNCFKDTSMMPIGGLEGNPGQN